MDEEELNLFNDGNDSGPIGSPEPDPAAIGGPDDGEQISLDPEFLTPRRPQFAGPKQNDPPPLPKPQSREIFSEHPKSRGSRMSTARLPNTVASPFFDLQTDPNNPVNAEFSKYLTETNKGTLKGESSITNPKTNTKYPKGFTPPIEFYADQSYRYFFSSATGELELDTSQPLSTEDTNLQNTNDPEKSPELGDYAVRQFGKPLPGRHIEYGTSLTYYDKKDGLKIFGAGNLKGLKNFYDGSGPLDSGVAQPNIIIDLDNLKPKQRYFRPDNIDPLTGESVEYGKTILDSKDRLKRVGTDPVGLLKDSRYGIYDKFGSYGAQNFLHGLDYFIDNDGNRSKSRIQALDIFKSVGRNGPQKLNEDFSTNNEPSSFQNVYLGEYFLKTIIENEDPTILGVDIRLKSETSPLLMEGDRSMIENFIRGFGTTYTEISSRFDILMKFREQLYKFIPTDGQSTAGDWPLATVGKKGAKIHYLQSVSGLDRLIEQPTGPDPKQFIDYGKDMLTLEYLEDVTQNMGYLSSLYKMLTWSKISGKQIIPPNLLKFDLEVSITEMRNYKRNVYDPIGSKIISYTDQISRYNYTLYECEFVFDKMPHGETVKNNSGTEILETFKLPLTYKFSTLEFKKFDGKITITDQGARINCFIINNINKNILKNSSDSIDVLNIDEYKSPNTMEPSENEKKSAGTAPNSNDLATNTLPEGPNSESEETTLEDAQESQDLADQEFASQSAPAQTEYVERDGILIPESGVFISNKTPDPIFSAMASNVYDGTGNKPILDVRRALLLRTLLNIREQNPGFPGKIQGAMRPDADQLANFKPPSRNSIIDSIQNNMTNSTSKPSDSNQGDERGFFQNPLVQNLKRDLKNAVVNQINRVILDRARLLNNAIEDIRNKIPFAGRMSEPTNVYTSTNAFRNDIINALRNFTGGAIKSFFKKPI